MNIIDKLINSDGSWNNEYYNTLVMWKGRYLKYLHQGLANKDPLIREGCAEALGDIGFLDSVPFLIEHVDDIDEHVRWDIVHSLEKILGFQPGMLIEWASCNFKNRHKLKTKLKEFWENNKGFILNDKKRKKFSLSGEESNNLWLSRYDQKKDKGVISNE